MNKFKEGDIIIPTKPDEVVIQKAEVLATSRYEIYVRILDTHKNTVYKVGDLAWLEKLRTEYVYKIDTVATAERQLNAILSEG